MVIDLYRCYNPRMSKNIYFPTVNNRTPEIISWILMIVVQVVIYFSKGSIVTPTFMIFAGYGLIFISILLSFGNWQDRKTSLSIDNKEIMYQSGLRKNSLNWGDVHQVYVYPGKYSDRLFVMGAKNRVTFSIQKKLLSDGKSQIGFPDGKEILEKIFSFSKIQKSSKKNEKSYYYYSK
jgi:hypothetical protein